MVDVEQEMLNVQQVVVSINLGLVNTVMANLFMFAMTGNMKLIDINVGVGGTGSCL